MKGASKREDEANVNLSLQVPLGGQGKLNGIVAVPETCPRGAVIIFIYFFFYIHLHFKIAFRFKSSSIDVSSGIGRMQCGSTVSTQWAKWKNLSLK